MINCIKFEETTTNGFLFIYLVGPSGNSEMPAMEPKHRTLTNSVDLTVCIIIINLVRLN